MTRSSMANRSPRIRRWILAAAAASLVLGPVAGGCAAEFDPPSKIEGLRVLAVVADKPYVVLKPDERDCEECRQVDFTLTYADTSEEGRNVQILWLGGCFDPEGDQYFACYSQLQQTLAGLQGLSPEQIIEQGKGVLGMGPTFSLTVPADLVDRREPPEAGPHYGIGYVFFTVCAGTVRLVPQEGTSEAGSFPLGCFDDEGRRLDASGFVPGYTQIYAFADQRTNENPVVRGLTLDGAAIAEDGDIPEVAPCPLTRDERKFQGCGSEDPFMACTPYEIEVDVPDDVAEVDADGLTSEGDPLREAVWVDYYVDGGDLDADVKLVSDPEQGPNDEREVKWIPPATTGLVRLWGVVHDSRGGTNWVQRYVRVVD